jgi:hypothetical protein
MSDGDAVVDEASGGGIVVDRTRDVLNMQCSDMQCSDMQCSDMQCSDMNGVLRGNLSGGPYRYLEGERERGRTENS